WSIRHGARPRRRAPDDLSAGARALFYRAAGHLWIFRARPTVAAVRAGVALHPGDELHGPGGGRLVQAPGDADADFPWHQPAAALRDRFFLAARSDPRAAAGRRLHLPLGF